MAYVYDNKTYRNLQQQVKENMDNIAELQDLKLVGIDVAGIVADYDSLPSSAAQGQLYAVGTSSPYELYVYNDSSWVDFGEFPKAGPQGEQGPQGEPGRQGPRGLTGPQGPRGYTGAPGTPGAAGPQGEKGPKGDPGPAGQDGTVSFDELTTAQLDMLKGPKGDTGPQGPQGPQGLQGLQGPEGPEGPMGPRGETGATGPKGDTGERGPQGIQGPKGDKGETGDTGPAGERGPIGPEGPQGPIGPEGPKGDKGDTGQEGPQGPIGPQGPKGDPGEVPPDVATKTYVDERYNNSKDYADKQIASATSNMVTTNTMQNITGHKIFSNVKIGKVLDSIKIEDSDYYNYVDIKPSGKITLADSDGSIDGVLNLPHVGTSPKTIAVTSDIPDTSKMVTTDTEQTITGKKVFGTLQATSLTDGTTTKTMTEVLAGGGSGEMIGLEIERLGTTTLTQELADKIASEPYKYYLRTQLGGGDYEIYSYSGIYLNSQKMKVLLWTDKNQVGGISSNNYSISKAAYYIEVNNDTNVVTPQIKWGGSVTGEALFNIIKSIPEELPIYQQEYIPTSGAVKNYVDAHSGGTTEEWTFTLSDGTTVTKNVKLG